MYFLILSRCYSLQQKERILEKAKKTHKQRVEVSVKHNTACEAYQVYDYKLLSNIDIFVLYTHLVWSWD